MIVFLLIAVFLLVLWAICKILDHVQEREIRAWNRGWDEGFAIANDIHNRLQPRKKVGHVKDPGLVEEATSEPATSDGFRSHLW